MRYTNIRSVLHLWLIIVSFCYISAPIALAAPAKPPLKSPEVELKDAQIIALSFDGIHVELALHVSNPNNQTITVEALNYQFTIENATPFSGRIQKREVFPAQENRKVSVALALPYGPATSALLQVLGNSEQNASYKLSGSIALLGSSKPHTFSHQGVLPSLKSMRL